MESNTAVLDKTREVIKDTCRGEVGVQLANNIATRAQLLHINEYAESYPRVVSLTGAPLLSLLTNPGPLLQRRACTWTDQVIWAFDASESPLSKW